MVFGDYLRRLHIWGNRREMFGRRRLPTLLFLTFIAAFSVAQTVLDLDGKMVNPLQPGSGQPVVLVFVREDCPISKRYAPTIQRMSENHQRDARFYLVFPDKSESSAVIRKYLSDFRYSIQGLRDPDHALVKQAHAQITPEAAVFDSKGALAYHGRIDNLYETFGRARPVFACRTICARNIRKR